MVIYIVSVTADFLDNTKRADYFKMTDYNVPTMDFKLLDNEYQELKRIILNSGGFFMQTEDFKTKEASMTFTLNG